METVSEGMPESGAARGCILTSQISMETRVNSFSFFPLLGSGQPSSRAASQTNVYLDAFGYRDNQAFDTMSVDSSDSIETSISACSPDNVSRWVLGCVHV